MASAIRLTISRSSRRGEALCGNSLRAIASSMESPASATGTRLRRPSLSIITTTLSFLVSTAT